jgi:hypothetical protein
MKAFSSIVEILKEGVIEREAALERIHHEKKRSR